MDLETENRIAAMLLKEAAELRRQAENEGVQVYLHPSKPRGRPNSRFLSATVLGVQQANRAVEENEMWRSRQKELELDKRLRRRIRDEDRAPNRHRNNMESGRTSRRQQDVEVDMGPSCSSRKRVNEDCNLREDEALRDDEVDDFLHSRLKRGRGAIGSRMDETGPYLPSSSDNVGKQLVTPLAGQSELPDKRLVIGPENPSFLGYSDYSEDESYREKQKTEKLSSSKEHSRKHKSKDKSRSKDKKKKKRTREQKRSKHRK